MNRYAAHQKLAKELKLLCSKHIPQLRLFDRTVGVFFAKRMKNEIGRLVPVTINQKGMADMYGMIKTKHGLIHIEIEFKTGKAVQTPEQKVWQKFIESMGGLYIVARDAKQATKQIIDYINQLNQ